MDYKKIVKEHKELINMNERYYTRRGKHSWDMNTYLVDTKEGVKYLIDNDDIIDENYPRDEFNGVVEWEDIVNLTNIELLKMYSWKTQELKYNPYIFSIIRR